MKETVIKQSKQPTNTPLDNIDETTYLLRSPANAEHLNKSITQFKMGNMFKKNILLKNSNDSEQLTIFYAYPQLKSHPHFQNPKYCH
ncbi:hypothetical protein [Providencia vermicola]|uniref:hypothetical protein n=1 Tax=Providencia vermicola TaxID=333965 RepID=UPI0032D9CC34